MTKEKLDIKLVEKALVLLYEKNYTVPKLCEELNINDECVVLEIIGYLELQNLIILKGFETIYREDGGCIHLCIYGIY